jgi:hypothetical protein
MVLSSFIKDSSESGVSLTGRLMPAIFFRLFSSKTETLSSVSVSQAISVLFEFFGPKQAMLIISSGICLLEKSISVS